ncbi:MAG: beta-ketoacyl-ACP synthase III [Cyclobacteriaceae bacterium]
MSKITAFGTYVPEKIVDNHYFEELIDTNDDWIITRTGIKTRHVAREDELASDLCVRAVEDMMVKSGKEVKDVDFIIVCTTSPDQTMPNTASRVQDKMGIENAGCNDIYAACAGFVYGLQIAHGFVNAGVYKKVLVIGGETLSRITDFKDRTSCILFGDGAGAALLEPSEEEHFLSFNSGTDGHLGHELYLTRENRIINGLDSDPNGKIIQNGKAVFKWAVGNIPIKIRDLVSKANLELKDIDFIIPHSANLRILEAISRDLKYPMEKIPESVTDHGNTSSASIPLALEKEIASGKIKPGMTILMIGFGGGLTFAGTIVKW